MSKKVINITKKKLKLGNLTLEPLKPVVLKDTELTNSIKKSLDGYVNLGFVKVFDIQETPLLYTQLQEYKEEQQIKLQQEEQKIEEQKEVEIVKVDETKEDVEKKTSKTTNKRKNTKKQEEEEVNEQ